MKQIFLMTMLTLSMLIVTACATTGFYCPSMECYTTDAIGPSDFVTLEGDEGKIVPLEVKCKQGYFMTGIKMLPETNPNYYTQYVITSEITCCRCKEK